MMMSSDFIQFYLLIALFRPEQITLGGVEFDWEADWTKIFGYIVGFLARISCHYRLKTFAELE